MRSEIARHEKFTYKDTDLLSFPLSFTTSPSSLFVISKVKMCFKLSSPNSGSADQTFNERVYFENWEVTQEALIAEKGSYTT